MMSMPYSLAALEIITLLWTKALKILKACDIFFIENENFLFLLQFHFFDTSLNKNHIIKI